MGFGEPLDVSKQLVVGYKVVILTVHWFVSSKDSTFWSLIFISVVSSENSIPSDLHKLSLILINSCLEYWQSSVVLDSLLPL